MAIDKHFIAKRVSKELQDGDVVNLGIGLPQLVANYVPEGIQVWFQGENGVLGLGPEAPLTNSDWDIFDAGGNWSTLVPGACYLNSADSFGLIRGGHVDITVLGSLQVDEEGNLANWMIPGKLMAGFGGAIDLVTCAKKVIVAMEHTGKGEAKILKKCTFPLTGKNCVDLIVTEKAVIDVTKDGLVLREIAPGLTVKDVQDVTEAKLIIPDTVKIMCVD